MKVCSVEVDISELSHIAQHCHELTDEHVPLESIILNYSQQPDLMQAGAPMTSLFTALLPSEVTISWRHKTGADLTLFKLPINVESLRVKILMQPFEDFTALSNLLKLNKQVRSLTFDRLPA